MYLFQSWSESLGYLLPEKFKMFVSDSCSVVAQAYRLFFRHFWGLFVIYIVYISIPVVLPIDWLMNYYRQIRALSYIDMLIGDILSRMLIFSLILCVWYAFSGKEHLSYGRYLKLFLLFLLCATVFMFFFGIIGATVSYIIHGGTVPPKDIEGIFFGSACLFTLLFFMFFFLDAAKTVRSFFYSIKNACVMFIYNYPLCMLLFAFFYGILVLIHYVLLTYITSGTQGWGSFLGMQYTVTLSMGQSLPMTLLLNNIIWLASVLLSLIPIAFVGVFYAKRRQEQPRLYIMEFENN